MPVELATPRCRLIETCRQRDHRAVFENILPEARATSEALIRVIGIEEFMGAVNTFTEGYWNKCCLLPLFSCMGWGGEV